MSSKLYAKYEKYPTSSWRPFGPAFGPSGLLDFVLHALRALRPCDHRLNFPENPKFPRKSDDDDDPVVESNAAVRI